MKLVKLLSVLSVLLACAFARAQSEVTVYTYNDRTPFVVDKEKKSGLEYRLCDWLSKESKGKYHFTLKVATAPEIRTLLDADKLNGVLLGVNASWFSESIQKKSLWTPPILFDKNMVVSLSSKRVDYATPASMHGHRVAVVKSWFYPEQEDSFLSGKASRVDFDSETLALKGVAAGKADVAIVSEWTFLYEQIRGDLQGDFFTANTPVSTFTRSILVPASLKGLHEDLIRILADVRKNAGWQEATAL